MITKTDQVRELVATKEYKEAIAVAKDFKLGFTKEEAKTLARAHEMTWNSRFYEMLGYNYQEELQKAQDILKRQYKGGEINK